MTTHHRQLRGLCFAPRVYFGGEVALTDSFVVELAKKGAKSIYMPRKLFNRVRLAQLPGFNWRPTASGSEVMGRGFYGDIEAGDTKIKVFSDAFDSVPSDSIELDDSCMYVLDDKGDVTAYRELSFQAEKPWTPTSGLDRGAGPTKV